MKKLNLLFTALMLVCCIGTAKAHDFKVGGIYYNITDATNKTVEVAYGNYTGSVVIPESVTYGRTYSVTRIGNEAFIGCSGLTSITIPNSVISIGKRAFLGCTGLTSITIPNSVTSIGEVAFAETAWYNSQPEGVVYAGKVLYKYKGTMPSNTSITIKDGTLGIGDGAFSWCSGLTSVIIPNSVTSIGRETFRECTGLTSITIPNSVTSIGNQAFYWCTGLTSILIPSSVKSIGEEAFSGCSGLTSILIPNSVKSIGKGAFEYCYGLTRIEIPNRVTSIEENTFRDCTGLKSIIIPNSVTTIGESAFYKCSGLTSVEIPNSVTSIGNYAFRFCSGLTSIEIPNSVTSIGEYAFCDCTGLTSVVIGNSVTSIGRYAFAGCSGLTSIEIPNSVTTIGESAFQYCYRLTNVVIGNSVTSIGSLAFAGTAWCNSQPDGVVYAGKVLYEYIGTMPSNTSITIKDGTLGIAARAFYNCKGLTSITIPNSVTSIGESAFNSCSSLKNIEFPNSITSIGYNAFALCTGLTSIEIPGSVTNIENSAFSACSSLESIVVAEGNNVYDSRNNCNAIIETATNTLIQGCQNTIIPRNITSIGHSAFFDCDGLTSIEIPNSVTTIEDYAFSGCDGFTSVTIPNSVTTIGGCAFNGCFGLEEVHISDLAAWCGIDFGDECANPFCNGINLYLNGELVTELVIPEGVKAIKRYAFTNCYRFTSVTIPNSVTTIENSAFSTCSSLESIVVAEGNNVYDSRNNCNAIIETATNTLVFGCQNTIIPHSVTSIGENAFNWCRSLTSIIIPNSVTSIGQYAFNACFGLKTVYNLSNLTFSKGSSDYGYVAFYADNVYNMPNGSKEGDFIFGKPNDVNTLLYYLGNATELALPANYKDESYAIGADVFNGNTTITNVEIPNSVTSIGNSAFSGCTGLTSITIPNSVTSIGNSAFQYCTGLISIEIPGNVESIGNSAFSGCTGLTSITIPNSVTSIGNSAFSGCTGLTSITIPNSVTSIGNSAFSGCTGLTSITIPNCVTSIGNSAFSGCTGLTSITIPNSVTGIGDDAFYGCKGLTSITIPNSVKSIGNNAFRGCSGLTSIIIGNSVEGIGESAFYGCKGLTYVEIPGNVTSIGKRAFYGCSLTSVVIPEKVTSIGNGAFESNRNLTEVTSLISADDLFEIENIITMTNAGKRNGIYKLYVPYGAKETYAATEGWKAFSKIVELEPVGLPGDINNDGEVNVGDFAALVNIIFNSESIDETIKSVSDINGDGEVNVGDFAALVNLIFNSGSQASPQRAATRAAADETTFYIEPFSIAAGETKVIPVLMENPGETFSQLQFDITLPEGLEIPQYFDEEQFDNVKDIKRGSRTKSVYSIQTQSVGEALRVLCITQNSKAYFTGESGDVLLITVKAADEMAIGDVDIKITNTVLSRQDGTTCKPADCTATVSVTDGSTTGIDEMKGENGEGKTIYDLQGRKVEVSSEGLYIIDGKKVVVK